MDPTSLELVTSAMRSQCNRFLEVSRAFKISANSPIYAKCFAYIFRFFVWVATRLLHTERPALAGARVGTRAPTIVFILTSRTNQLVEGRLVVCCWSKNLTISTEASGPLTSV